MNDPDYIESLASIRDEKEIYYRSIGMFELAEWYQWAADSTRRRQHPHATRGSGGSAISVSLSNGWFMAIGDMTPADVQKAGKYLVDQAIRKIEHDASETLASLTAATAELSSHVQALLLALKPPASDDYTDGPR
jgi:hypothetical protein